MDRRDFLKTGVLAGGVAGLTARPAAQAGSGTASDRMRMAFIGMGARAHQLCDAALAIPNVEVVSLCDAYTRPRRARPRAGGRQGAHRRRLPEDPRRSGRERGLHRDAGPLASADDARRAVGRQGRLSREADDVPARGRARDHRRRREAPTHPPGRQPGGQLRAAAAGARDRQVRPARADHDGARRRIIATRPAAPGSTPSRRTRTSAP